MSDGIFERDSQYGKEMGWHKKTQVRKILTKDEVYPYFVKKDYLYRDGGSKKHGEYFTPVCSDDELPIGDGPCLNDESYALLSPKDFWDYTSEMLEGTDHEIVSAGSVQNRSKIFISVKLNNLKDLNIGDRKFNIYLNFISSMDRSIPFVATNTSICTVCQNTLLANFFSDSLFKYKFKHSKKSFEENLIVLKRMVDDTFGVAAEFNKYMNDLNSVECKESDAREIFTGFFASENAEKKIADSQKMQTRLTNRVDEYLNLFNSGLGNRGETMLDALSAVTQFNTRTEDPKKQKRLINGEFETSQVSRPVLKARFAKMLVGPESRIITQDRGRTLLKLINS